MMTTPDAIGNDLLNQLQQQANPLNATRQDTTTASPDFAFKQLSFKINENYTLFKLYLNAVMVAGFDEVSLNTNSLFHINNVRDALNFLRLKGFSNVICSTLEESLFNQLSFFANSDRNQRTIFNGEFYRVYNALNEQQKSALKDRRTETVNVEAEMLSAAEVETNLSPEDAAISAFFKMIFELCNNVEIGLIGQALRGYFKHRYQLRGLSASNVMFSLDEMLNAPLYVILPEAETVTKQIAEWVSLIRKEQLALCNIKSDESTGKILEVGIDENLDKAIENTLSQLPLKQLERKGISLNQLQVLLNKYDTQWQFLIAGLEGFYNHIIMR